MVAARGPALVVAYIEVAHNEFPAKQYLDQLRAERGDAYHAAVLHLFKWIADHGRIQNIEKFRQLDDGIVEFKRVRLNFDDGMTARTHAHLVTPLSSSATRPLPRR